MCNTIPLRNILSLYEDIGIPVTISKILNYLLSKTKIDQQKSKSKIRNQIYGKTL